MEEIIERLNAIEQKIDALIVQKETLNFTEAARYLNLSKSHLYKLTSAKEIPHSKPRNKQVYFERRELDQWLLQNRQTTKAEIEQSAIDYVVKGGKR